MAKRLSEQDRWAQWMLHRRFGGDPERQKEILEALAKVRERVLDNAKLSQGETLLDVGTGDGLIAFGGLERVGEDGKVILSDISQDLLDHARSLAEEMGVLDRCEFIRASAEDLSIVGSESVDVVTTRSVLIFVKNKKQAFEEFYRVLKPGGRISLFEPINRFSNPQSKDKFWTFDVTPVADLAAKVKAVYEKVQPPDDPMLDFDERDLIRLAEEAGFSEVHLQYEADVAPADKAEWERNIKIAPNPLVPTFEEAMTEALTPDERVRFVTHLRPLMEEGKGVRRSAVAYLWAVKLPGE